MGLDNRFEIDIGYLADTNRELFLTIQLPPWDETEWYIESLPSKSPDSNTVNEYFFDCGTRKILPIYFLDTAENSDARFQRTRTVDHLPIETIDRSGVSKPI